MPECYLHFRKDRFRDKKSFSFDGCVVAVDVGNGEIYAYDNRSSEPAPYLKAECHIIGPFKEEEFIVFSSINENGIINPYFEKYIRNREGSFCKLTNDEISRVETALARYKADRVASIYWPGQEDAFGAAIRRAGKIAAPFNPGETGAYADALVRDIPDRPPEVLLTPEEVAGRQTAAKELFRRFNGGSGRPADPKSSSLITAELAAASRNLASTGPITDWRRRYPEESPRTPEGSTSVFVAPPKLRNPFFKP